MRYEIFLDGKQIGFTAFEKADPPMGVVFGMIDSINDTINYLFLDTYCSENNIECRRHPKDHLICTMNIPRLKVLSPSGTLIQGISTYIEGMDSEGFEIFIMGIGYPLYEELFPEHVKAYAKKK